MFGFAVGAGDSSHRHPESIRQGAMGRQALAGGQAAIGDILTDGVQ
jgi:hypothetical protein